MFSAKLRHAQGDANFVFRGLGKVQQVGLCRSHPKQGLSPETLVDRAI
jgi:hypothetical protein